MNHHGIKGRVVSTTALIASATLFLAGCSAASGSSGSSDGHTISVASRWTTGTSEGIFLADYAAEFEKSTGISVDIIDGGEEMDNTVETATAAGQAPDVVIVNLFDKTLGWLDAGVTVDVNDYLTDWGLESRISEAATSQWRVDESSDGKLRGFPFSGFAWPIWYNTELLSSAGIDSIPTTTDELIVAAKALRAAGVAPMIAGGNDWTGQKLFYQIIQSYTDAKTIQDTMQEGTYCSTPDVYKGIELFAELTAAGVFADNVEGLTSEDMNNTYYSQKAAIMSAGSWAFRGAVEAGNGIVEATQLGGFPLPSGASHSAPTAYQGFSNAGFMVTKSGAENNIDAVQEFISGFYTDEMQSTFVNAGNNVSVGISDLSGAATDPLLGQALSLGDAVDYVVLPDVWIGTASEPITQVTSMAFGGADAEKICAGLDSASK